MTDPLILFPPHARAAAARLAEFVPRAGADYAARRNFDLGPEARDNVSSLSPYVKLRMLDEIAMTRAVLARHSEASAQVFLREVFWRTYWKGWMELRPAVLVSYQQELRRLADDLQTQSGLRTGWRDACLGRTGIVPFDAWAQELVTTGYLHNHARMWFASIWVFTLGLPWQLGADFFLRHLLDGDAAVNTLSWRWVVGLQTRGKTYLAKEDNIARFTGGRFTNVSGLAREILSIDPPEPPQPRELPKTAPEAAEGRYGIVLHCDDIDIARLLTWAPSPVAWAFLDAEHAQTPWLMAPHVSRFRLAAAQDQIPPGQTLAVLDEPEALRDWAVRENLDQIICGHAPVGPAQQMIDAHAGMAGTVTVTGLRRPLDSAA